MLFFKKKKPPVSEEARFRSSEVSRLLVESGLFTGDFCSRVSAEVLAGHVVTKLLPSDLASGVSINEALAVLNQRQRLVAAYASNRRQLRQAIAAGAPAVCVNPYRPCSGCSRVPKKKKYKPTNAPLYPCSDCKEMQPCIFFYEILF